ncbi:transposase [Desulfatibacillum aliphaticivorans]|uniref:transposase n=1 Tax=Desulfatibacillum aliphaticivorans TaxID=218208 RepID=UPI00048723A0|nr:transposase [Desulfatibacillum aliphaticivorans]
MPRKSRIDAPGLLHHVMIRGIERKPIFADDQDRDALMDRLALVLPETQTACYAWVFMENHAHFLFRSSPAGISHIMRRLMTGYAGYFNRRHVRHGPLFQNRFKSVLCQENAYFKELVRYIHLNPVRAGVASDLKELAGHRYCGHRVLLGKSPCPWQDTEFVLADFGNSLGASRRRYADFVKVGLNMGRRDDLTGGGLVRSLGGWEAVKATFPSKESRQKSDQRILGDGDFVQSILNQAKENLSGKYLLAAKGIDRKKALKKASALFGVAPAWILTKSRQQPLADARSLYCYWAARKLGISQAELSRELAMTSGGVTHAVNRGRRIAMENRYVVDD